MLVRTLYRQSHVSPGIIAIAGTSLALLTAVCQLWAKHVGLPMDRSQADGNTTEQRYSRSWGSTFSQSVSKLLVSFKISFME